jgi:hypothetical protein
MTSEDAAYCGWLNLLGSDEITDTDPGIAACLHTLHDRAEASHRTPADIAALAVVFPADGTEELHG